VLDYGAGGGLGEGLASEAAWAGGIAVDGFFEERFFVAEGGVEAGAVDAHGGGEIGEGSALVALAPEDL